jgi:two-component system, LuxR family, response regulator DctR
MEDKGARILVADDDPLFRDALAVTLSDEGFHVCQAASSAEGKLLMERTSFDLVVADIHMAGNERLEWLHALASRPRPVPVIVVTGSPTLDTAIDAVRLPVTAYLVKPIDARKLLDEVTRALRPAPTIEARLIAVRERWGLSERQTEVLARAVGGASNKEIAESLGSAVRTIEVHMGALFQRSGARSRTELVARFWSDGW